MAEFNRISASVSKLRVLADRGYSADFNIDLGQANAIIDRRDVRPKLQMLRGYDPMAMTLRTGRGYDLMHLFNAVPLWPLRPFIVTFEAEFPRAWPEAQPRMRRYLFDRVMGPRCRALIAISQYALNLFRQLDADLGVQRVMAKTRLLYPSVVVTGTPRKAGEELRLVFVGKEFLRKGAAVVTRAHAELRRRGVPVRTTIVSTLAWSPTDYTGPRAGFDVEAEKSRLGQEGITHHTKLDNARVRELMSQADFCLLPTMHDTFGYSVIESLAAGTPVIASDTCALPEMIQPDRNGYLLPIENSQEGHWDWLSRKNDPAFNRGFLDAVERMASALADILHERWERRADHERLSAGAVAVATERFNRPNQRAALETLYESCMKK